MFGGGFSKVLRVMQQPLPFFWYVVGSCYSFRISADTRTINTTVAPLEAVLIPVLVPRAYCFIKPFSGYILCHLSFQNS